MGTLKIRTTGSVNVSKPKTIKISTYSSNIKNDGSHLGYLAGRIGIGTAGIFEGISDFVQGSYYQLIGDKEYAKYLHMNDVTGGWRERLDKNYNPGGVMKVVGDIAEGVGQAIPSLAVGVATAGVGTAVGVAGNVAVATGYMGRGVTDAVKQTGELGAKENIYGIATGALEGITDRFLGGIQKSGKVLVNGMQATAKAGAKTVARKTLVKGILSSAGSEALEEFIQEYADTALLRLTKVNKEAEFSLENALYSAFIGGMTGGLMGSATGVVNETRNYKIGEDIKARGLEEQLMKTADYVRDEHLGNVKNFANVTNESLRNLTASVDAYRKLSDKSGRQGSILLGEIKRSLLSFEMSAGVDNIKTEMMKSTAEKRQSLAKSATALYGKEITAEDIATNKDDITRRLAMESFIGSVMSESTTEVRRAQMNEAIASERLPYINQSASWNGEGSVKYRDPKTGQYIIVEPSGEEGKWNIGYSKTAVYNENEIMIKSDLDTDTIKKTLVGLADGSFEIGENGIRRSENTQKSDNENGKKSHSLIGVAEDGRKIYQGNFPKGTPKVAKSERILEYIKNVWSKKPIRLLISNGETSRYIYAQFDPTVDETQNVPTDASKLAGGNRHGNHTEQRVTLDLADDYYEIASEAEYNYSKYETGKTIEPHQHVKMWHYFVKEIYFVEQGSNLLSPYTVTINVKEKADGNYVYSFNAEKEFSTRQTLHAAVNTIKGANGELFLDNSIPQNSEKSTENAKKIDKNFLVNEKEGKNASSQDARKRSLLDENGENEQRGESEAKRASEREYLGKEPSNMSEREKRRGYSDDEANTARELVKDFDVLSREKRIAIIEMIRSAEACKAKKSFMKHAAAMIGYWRKGLYIIADNKTSEKGFYQTFEDGTRLIVVNPASSAKNAINVAFVHELAHDIWTKATDKTKDTLYRMATESATAAEVEDIRKEYTDGYEKRGLKINDDVLREEVFTNLIGKTLGNEAFLERFDITPGRMTAFKRSLKAVTRMAKCFFGKNKSLYSRTEKMARALIRVMGAQLATETVGKTEKMYSIVGPFFDDAGTYFENAVLLDTNFFDGISPRNWWKNLKSHIEKNADSVIFKIFDENGFQQELRFAKKTDRTVKNQKKNHAILSELYKTQDNLSKLAVIHIDEIIEVSEENNPYYSDLKNHGWMDDGGWLHRNANVINAKTGVVYNLTIDIAKTNDGRVILYATKGKIKKVGQTKVNSLKMKGSTSHSNFNNSISQNSKKSTPKAKKSFSLNGNNTEFDPEAFIDQAIRNGFGENVDTEVKSKTEKSQTSDNTKAELKEAKREARGLRRANEQLADTAIKAQEKNRELREENRQLKKEAQASEVKAKNAEKKSAAEKERMEKEMAIEAKKLAAKLYLKASVSRAP